MSSVEDLPPQFKKKKLRPMPKTGKIPIKDLFDAIYETVDSQEVRETAPEELRELKLSLESVLKQINSIARKMKRPKKSR